MLLPGPEAQQLATYIGWLLHQTRGGPVAGLLFILPGFVLMLGVSVLYALYSALPWMQGVLFGLQAATLAIVVEALLRVSRRALKSLGAYLLAAAAFIAIFAYRVPFSADRADGCGDRPRRCVAALPVFDTTRSAGRR